MLDSPPEKGTMEALMRKIRTVTGVFAAIAIVAMALPVTVGACPTRPEGEACCCAKASAAGQGCCCCPKPTQPSPDHCAALKARPDVAGADAPPDPTPPGAGVLAETPSLTPPASTPGVSFHARIQPGWDPGNFGLLIPLRL